MGAGVTRIELLRGIVKQHQARKIRIDGQKVLVDAVTAGAMVAVHDALNDDNRAKYLALPWPKMVKVTWALVR